MNNIKIKYGELYVFDYNGLLENKQIFIFFKPECEDDFLPINFYNITKNKYDKFYRQSYAKDIIRNKTMRLLNDEQY